MNGRSIYRFLIPALLWATLPAAAQTGGISFGYTPNGIANIDAYRPLQSSVHFNNRFLRDSTYVYEAPSTDSSGRGQEWLLRERSVHQYDNDGNENVTIRSVFEDEKWELSERLEHSYRSGSDLEKTLKKVWSDGAKDWLKHEQHTYSYTYGGQELEVLTERWAVDRWSMTSLSEKFYDDREKLKRHITSQWSNGEIDWVPEEQLIYTYKDDSELPVTEVVQTWSDSLNLWVNKIERSFVYDDDDNIIEAVESAWNSEIEGFIPSLHTEWAYNSDGQQADVITKPLIEVDSAGTGPDFSPPLFGSSALYNEDGNLNQLITQEWDKSSKTWQPVRYEKHYWSQYVTGRADIPDSEITCIYANPHTIGLPWFCNSLKRDVQYTVEFFDLTGRLYYADTFMGGNTFRIKRNIPSGVYIALITGGLDRHSEKVIIR